MTNKKLIVASVILIVGLILTVFLAQKQQEIRSRASEQQTSFELSQASGTIDVGHTLTVNLSLNNPHNFAISGFDVTLAFNKDSVENVIFTPSSRFDRPYIHNDYSLSTGNLRITAVRVMNRSNNGKIEIGTLSFRAKATGTATINVSSTPQIVAHGRENPLQTASGTIGSFTIRQSQTPSPLPTPTPSFPPSPAPRYEGYVDVSNCIYLTGWAADRSRKNTPITVDMRYDGIPFTTRNANLFRRDLPPYLGDNGYHAFTMPTPLILKDGKQHIVTWYFGGTNIKLGTNDKKITCSQ